MSDEPTVLPELAESLELSELVSESMDVGSIDVVETLPVVVLESLVVV